MRSDFDASWFPGHMAKSIKRIQQIAKFVDFWFEIVDARAPISSRSDHLLKFNNGKPVVIVLNKADLANDLVTNSWISHFKKLNIISIKSSNKIRVKNSVLSSVKKLNIKKKFGNSLRAAVIGVPNVGKSCFINNLKGSKKLKVENKAGVTRDLNWVSCGNLEICDTPGLLPPKIEPNFVRKIAYLGLIKDEIIDSEELALNLISDIKSPDDSFEFLNEFAKKSGCLLHGGTLDLQRASSLFIKQFRDGKFGKISLEAPFE